LSVEVTESLVRISDFSQSSLKLPEKTIHVWHASLISSEATQIKNEMLLSEDERERGSRFCFERDQRRFILRRGILRKILSLYLQAQPSELSFSYSSRGKPILRIQRGIKLIQFSYSHSGEMAIYAITRGTEIGIDLEKITPVEGLNEIAKRFFTEGENLQIKAAHEMARSRAFLKLWTRKEAILKATGEGIAELGKVDVIEDGNYLEYNGARWWMNSFRPSENYLAAIAIQAFEPKLMHFRWTEEITEICTKELYKPG
jgi:4'-phosphopantetheinyl transferase